MAGPQHASSPARPTPALSLGAIAGLAIVVVAAAAVPIPWSITTRFEPLNTARNFTPTPLANPGSLLPPDTGPEPVAPAWLGIVFWSLVFLALAVLAGLLLRRLWRMRPRRLVQVAPESAALPPASGTAADAILQRGARTALALLDEIPEPRDAVVRAWLALEQAAAASGAPRRPADSPTEFTGGVLGTTAADPAAVSQLLRLYHQARFSEHPIETAEVRQARACVLSLSRSLSGYEDALRSSAQVRS